MKKLLILLLLLFTTDSFATGISGGTTAPCDNATLNKYTGTANVEINWEPNTINLNWYDGDTKLTVANNSQTCVYDGTLTVPTQPTKPGYTFNGWKVIRVPGGFTELQYVHFDGTSSTGAYVDTGLKFYTDIQNTKVRFIADAKVYSGSDWQVIVGNLGYNSDYIGTNKYNLLYYGFGTTDTSTNVNNTYERYLFDADTIAKTYKIKKVSDNTEIVNISGVSMIDRKTVLNVYLGGFNDTVGTTAMRPARANMDLYSVKIYNNGELMFNGIPAKRNVDNVVGIYDTISGTFKTNATGTNALTAGPVVQ